MTLVKIFKYELIKIVVFLFLFALSLFFVAISQDEYYAPHPKQYNSTRDTSAVKTTEDSFLHFSILTKNRRVLSN